MDHEATAALAYQLHQHPSARGASLPEQLQPLIRSLIPDAAYGWPVPHPPAAEEQDEDEGLDAEKTWLNF